MKSGNLNFLEPCGPLQACNGTDLRFYQLHDVTSVAFTSNFTYSKQKSTYTRCLRELHSVPKVTKVASTSHCSVTVSALSLCHLQQIFHHRKSSAASARGALVVNLTPWLLPTAKKSPVWKSPTSVLHPVHLTEISSLCRQSKSDPSGVQPVTELSVCISKFPLQPPTVPSASVHWNRRPSRLHVGPGTCHRPDNLKTPCRGSISRRLLTVEVWVQSQANQ